MNREAKQKISRFRRIGRKAAIAALALAGLVVTSASVVYWLPADDSQVRGQIGAGHKLETAYLKWRQGHEEQGGDSNFVLALGWSKAYSRQATNAGGFIQLDLIGGTAKAEISNIGDADISDLWAVDNQEGPGRSAAPEPGDRMLLLGRLQRQGDQATLEAELGNAFQDFEVDLVVATPSGKTPDQQGVLFGSPTLFQRLYTRARLGRLELPAGDGSLLQPVLASSLVPSFDPLIEEGAKLFFNETFKGNGRTCGTCHPADNNLTIEPEFIATLPKTDPLFVAEFVPALAENFEKPELMRKLGLILENTNGFGDLENDFTMRGVPHTLALPLSLNPAPGGADGTTVPPVQRTGWSGDGSPNDGSLRQFAQGAITQHFPKTLDRRPNYDFRLATDSELDAMEAFQLSLGRQEELDLSTITPKNEIAARGKELFLNEGKCNACHANAGANVSFIPGGFNFNFNTGVEDLPDQPADLVDAANNPPDDGFGNPGNGTFNTPVIVEAADTGPFFHNNAIETIEGAVAFYNSDAFNNSPGGIGAGGVDLEPTQVIAIAAFLRVLNADENAREASETLEFVLDVTNLSEARALIKLAVAEIEDAIEVLDCGGLHPDVQALLKEAKAILTQASAASLSSARDDRIAKALEVLAKVRASLLM